VRIELPTDKITSRERYLEAIVESAIDYAIISMDLDGLVTSWNEGANKILGWSADEMIGKPATAFFTEEDRENGVPQSEMMAALQKGKGNDERWHLRANGTCFWASGEMMPLKTEDDKVIGFVKILRDRTKEREQAERERLMTHELNHRMKNTLSVVQSIVTQTIRNAGSLEDAGEKLESRLSAYSKAHDILVQKQWLSATFDNIVETAKVAIGWADSERIKFDGPTVTLGPEAALSISMVIHELLTNAMKYGALSNADGHIETSWNVSDQGDGDRLIWFWREIGGPIVSQPTRSGFGSRLVTSSLRAFGEAVLSYQFDGFAMEAEMPLSKVQYRNDLAKIDALS